MVEMDGSREYFNHFIHFSIFVHFLLFISLSSSLAVGMCAICVQDGYTALILAVNSQRLDCARLLLDAGADKEAKQNVRSRKDTL